MITDSFDYESEAIISPGSFFGPRKDRCFLAIGTFSREIYKAVLKTYPCRQIGELQAANRVRPLHLLSVDGMEIAFYLSEIGATLASTDVIEVNWKTGAEHFVLFGSAGALDREATEGRYVVPTESYRDEGMSYHYAPPADYISIRNAGFVEEVLRENALPYVCGRVWTTDALYRETRGQVKKRKAEGCIAVEMELAGLQAVCDFHGLQLYDFLVTGDVVDQEHYTPEGLSEANHSMDKFDIASKIAERIAERVKVGTKA